MKHIIVQKAHLGCEKWLKPYHQHQLQNNAGRKQNINNLIKSRVMCAMTQIHNLEKKINKFKTETTVD